MMVGAAVAPKGEAATSMRCSNRRFLWRSRLSSMPAKSVASSFELSHGLVMKSVAPLFSARTALSASA